MILRVDAHSATAQEKGTPVQLRVRALLFQFDSKSQRIISSFFSKTKRLILKSRWVLYLSFELKKHFLHSVWCCRRCRWLLFVLALTTTRPPSSHTRTHTFTQTHPHPPPHHAHPRTDTETRRYSDTHTHHYVILPWCSYDFQYIFV